MRGAMTSFTHHIPIFFLNDPKWLCWSFRRDERPEVLLPLFPASSSSFPPISFALVPLYNHWHRPCFSQSGARRIGYRCLPVSFILRQIYFLTSWFFWIWFDSLTAQLSFERSVTCRQVSKMNQPTRILTLALLLLQLMGSTGKIWWCF